jgi:hypothetical protein
MSAAKSSSKAASATNTDASTGANAACAPVMMAVKKAAPVVAVAGEDPNAILNRLRLKAQEEEEARKKKKLANMERSKKEREDAKKAVKAAVKEDVKKALGTTATKAPTGRKKDGK